MSEISDKEMILRLNSGEPISVSGKEAIRLNRLQKASAEVIRNALGSQEGAAISELRDYIGVEARELLATFVATANALNLPTSHFDRKASKSGAGQEPANSDHSVDAWRIQTGSTPVSIEGIDQEMATYSLLTPDYRVLAEHPGDKIGGFTPDVIRESMDVALLLPDRVEPDISTYL